MKNTIESPKFFYGWYLVGVSLVSGAFQTGIGIWGVSVFVSPMEDELGWSRTSFMLALTIRTALTGLLSPVVGPWRDTKNGPRVLMLAGSIIMGMSLETFFGGWEGNKELKAEIGERTGLNVATGAEACKAALNKFGARRISVITPYQVPPPALVIAFSLVA